MLTFDSAKEKLDQWKVRLFDEDEATRVEAATMLVDVANKSKDLRRECTSLMALHLEKLHKSGADLFFTLKAVSDLSRGSIASSEPLMRALLKLPIKDSYALNMATSILMYEMSQGFITPDHPLAQQVLDMALEIARRCKGDARRNAMRILELAQAHSRRQPEGHEP